MEVIDRSSETPSNYPQHAYPQQHAPHFPECDRSRQTFVSSPSADAPQLNPQNQSWTSGHKATSRLWRSSKFNTQRALSLWLAAALLAVVLAAVGGGIGGTLAVEKARKACVASAAASENSAQASNKSVIPEHRTASNTQVSTSSPTAEPEPPTMTNTPSSQTLVDFQGSSTISLGSPSGTWGPMPSIIPIPELKDFTYTSPGTGVQFNVYHGRSHQGDDIAWIVTYTIEQCLEACASYRWLQEERGAAPEMCLGVEWEPERTNTGMFGVGVNCYLKRQVGGWANRDGLFWLAVIQ